jgi:hypothetical protein
MVCDMVCDCELQVRLPWPLSPAFWWQDYKLQGLTLAKLIIGSLVKAPPRQRCARTHNYSLLSCLSLLLAVMSLLLWQGSARVE